MQSQKNVSFPIPSKRDLGARVQSLNLGVPGSEESNEANNRIFSRIVSLEIQHFPTVSRKFSPGKSSGDDSQQLF